MTKDKKNFRTYLSLILLFVPAFLFGLLLFLNRNEPVLHFSGFFPFVPWQFYAITFFGLFATVGGVIDWKFHREVVGMKMSKKERNAEALALGFGGVPMFFLMWFAMMSSRPSIFLIPILLVLIFTVVAISYDEFIFHRRCGKLETVYHRVLVLGNGVAWLAWFHFIFYR